MPAKKKKKGHKLTPAKAKEILRDGTVHGKPISKRQRGYFGVVASGKKPKKSARRKK